MTTESTPTVPPFEVSTPFGVCTVSDIRVPHDGELFARVTFDKTLKVNAKEYDSRVDFELEPVTGTYRINPDNNVYQIATGLGGYTGGLTENARKKVREYLCGPEVLNALTRIGVLAPPDPGEVRAYKRERVYYAAASELQGVIHDRNFNMPPEEREARVKLREELLDEVLIRIVSRRLDGMSWSEISRGEFGNE